MLVIQIPIRLSQRTSISSFSNRSHDERIRNPLCQSPPDPTSFLAALHLRSPLPVPYRLGRRLGYGRRGCLLDQILGRVTRLGSRREKADRKRRVDSVSMRDSEERMATNLRECTSSEFGRRHGSELGSSACGTMRCRVRWRRIDKGCATYGCSWWRRRRATSHLTPEPT
jgi:hypothetical protein